MNKITADYLKSIELGQAQSFGNMTIFPIFTPLDNSPEYIAMQEALEKNFLTVTEVDNSGSVPELKVVNNAEIPILILDGEELIGAKQNRILNTTVLLKEKTKTIIPVSCVESGRWSYKSDKFYSEETMAAAKLRRTTSSSVFKSLLMSRKHSSDQSAVWGEVEEYSRKSDFYSPTMSMKEVTDSKKNEIDDYLKSFQILPKQKGMLVFLNGEIVGFDFISLESAYTKIHQKLIKSYAMDAILSEIKEKKDVTKELAKAFLEKTTQSDEKEFKSVSLGSDYRFEGKDVLGSALIHQDKVIHMAFFKIDEKEKVGNISSSERRRTFRTRSID
jgi:hypothetical protein